MELIQPLTTSVVRFVVASGQAFIPDLIRAAQDRYRFWSVPASLEAYSRTEGAEFSTGLFEGTIIDALRIHSNALVVEGKAHSDKLDAFADDVMAWAKQEFGLNYEYLAPVARSYTSTVEVRSAWPLARYLVEIRGVAELLTQMVQGYGFETAPYEFTTLTATTDPELARPLKPGRFVFDRRAGKAYNSDLFFSEAPVSTSQHMELLNMLESTLTSASKPHFWQSPPAAPASST